MTTLSSKLPIIYKRGGGSATTAATDDFSSKSFLKKMRIFSQGYHWICEMKKKRWGGEKCLISVLPWKHIFVDSSKIKAEKWLLIQRFQICHKDEK